MDSIQIKNLTYRYPTSEADVLKDVSFTVKKGELCAIVGAGDVLVNGRDVKEDPDGKNALEIGFVFQNPFTQISGIASTVYEELAYGLENMGVEPEEIRQRIERIMELTKIQEFRDRDPYQLSGGQQQRVALAAILVMDQDVLVIDEPTSQLDPQSTDDVFEIIKLMKSMGKTIVLVEHKMEQIAEYADQIIVLDGGQVVMEGTPKEVFSDPDCLKYHTRPPQSTRIALELKKEGVNLSEIPVTVEETVGMIRTAMEE